MYAGLGKQVLREGERLVTCVVSLSASLTKQIRQRERERERQNGVFSPINVGGALLLLSPFSKKSDLPCSDGTPSSTADLLLGPHVIWTPCSILNKFL